MGNSCMKLIPNLASGEVLLKNVSIFSSGQVTICSAVLNSLSKFGRKFMSQWLRWRCLFADNGQRPFKLANLLLR